MQSQEVPPGYDTDSHTKPKTKAVKRNERKKEKRHQVCSLIPFILDFLVRTLSTYTSVSVFVISAEKIHGLLQILNML